MKEYDPNTPDITIRLQPQQQIPASKVNSYGLAGKVVISDTSWPELEPFRNGSAGEWQGDDLPVLQEFEPPKGEADRNVEGWVAEKDRLVSCRDVDNGCRVAITDIGEFFVSATGDQIIALSTDPAASAAEIMMTLFGPPMILAFAAQDVWLMHAGAVEQGGGAWLFIGPSGAGKSTLARELSRRGFSGRRLADDMTPIRLDGDQAICLPVFPQLKLGDAVQFADFTLQLPLAGLCILEKSTGDAVERVSLQRLTGVLAVYELTRQTMGVSLFPAAMRARHLAFLTNCIALARIERVVYPHHSASIAELALLLMPGGTCSD